MNTFKQNKNLQIHLSEKRCKSELVKDFKKLHEFLDIVELEKFLNNQNKEIETCKELEKDIIIKTLTDITIKDKLFNIYIKLNDNVKKNVDMNKIINSVNKTLLKACKINNYAYKKYIFPSGKIVNYQGYENIALDELLKMHEETDIENDRKHIPNIKYMLKNKVHYYYPDIYIKSENLIIEVKSIYTYKQQLIKNITKSLAVKKAGYNFEFWIYMDKAKNKIII